MKTKLHPVDAKEALKWWDEGESIFSIEMGGLGPGYEQCIHIVCFELIRALLGKKLPDDKDQLNAMFDKVLFANKKVMDLGLSGAQAAAGKNLAYQYLKSKHWHLVLDKVPSDRQIQVQKTIPQG